MNITLDDSSPQIQYISTGQINKATPGWIRDHGPNTTYPDGQIGQYYQKTFTATFGEGDYVLIQFNGTAIYVFGARRNNHGAYSSQLDGGSEQFQMGYAQNDFFNQVLFNAGGLAADQQHTLVLKNLPSQTDPSGTPNVQWWLDIDYVVITAAATGKVYTTTFDDTSSYVTYNGPGWSFPVSSNLYYNSTAHITRTVGDSMSLQFNGSSIQLFGGLYYDHGNYSISLDGINQPSRFNGSHFDLLPRGSLFQASGLKDGPHTIILTNVGTGSAGAYLDFDYAVANSTVDPSLPAGANTGTNQSSSDAGSTSIPKPIPTGSGPSGNNSSSSGSSGQGNANQPEAAKTNIGAIVGGVVAGVAVLALAAFLFFWLRKRNSHKKRRFQTPVDLTGDEVKPFPPPPAGHQQSYNPGASMSGSARPHTSPLNVDPAMLAATAGGGYPHSVNPPSSTGSPSNGNGEIPRSVYAGIDGNSNTHIPGSNGTGYSYSAVSTSELPYRLSTAIPIAQRPPETLASSDSIYSHSQYHGYQPQSNISRSNTGVSPISPEENNPTSTSSSRLKSQVINMPYTSRPPTAPSSTTNSTLSPERTSRLVVEGREVDMGPMMLPPNYEQATEPLPGQRPDDDTHRSGPGHL